MAGDSFLPLDTQQPVASTEENTNAAPPTQMDEIFERFKDLEFLKNATKTNQFQNANPSQKKPFTATDSKKTNNKAESSYEQNKMTLSDVAKLRNAQDTVKRQAFMIFAFFPVALIVMAFLASNTTLLLQVAVICLIILLIIVGSIFLPGYLKMEKDLENRQKMKVKIKIKDLAEEEGIAYLVVKPNQYGIKTIQAPSKYYSTSLLNKELEIYVSKESHTLLEIIEARY